MIKIWENSFHSNILQTYKYICVKYFIILNGDKLSLTYHKERDHY